MTKTVENGNTVTLHYKGTLEDGTEFDSSYARGEPMTVTTGAGQLIEGFDRELTGMTEGDSKTFTLEPAEAYGERDDAATTELDRAVFPDDFEFTSGMTVPLMGPGGQSFLATLTEIAEETITADLNHPMAGKSLTFEVEVLSVDEAVDE
jgi:FKBP-type peptidyl-prolyl cis-trans isomerase 2